MLEPFTLVVDFYLGHGYFPGSLKITKTVPIYKTGDKTLPSSYRPFSIIKILF